MSWGCSHALGEYEWEERKSVNEVFEVCRHASRGAVVLRMEGRTVEFVDVPDIQRFQEENPGVSTVAINQLLALSAAFSAPFVAPDGTFGVRHSTGVLLGYASEDAAWGGAAQAAVKQHGVRVALERCDELCDKLSARYPEAGLSFGYIGNIERWGDDRGWRFFTHLKDAHWRDMSFGSQATENLPRLLEYAEKGLEPFLRKHLRLDTEVPSAKVRQASM